MPLISPPVESIILATLQEKAIDLKSQIHAINTVPDHIHIAVSIPPSLSVSQWVKQIKGRTAHAVNTQLPQLDERFSWQGGYGVLTFGEKMLPTVCNYIERQKEHHHNNTLEPYLEHMENEPET